jgi:NhaP-type Na+/H+ or K+/H+ antiporter
LQYGDDSLSFGEALTLGTILTAIDPVSVVQVLKDLGATVRYIASFFKSKMKSFAFPIA